MRQVRGAVQRGHLNAVFQLGCVTHVGQQCIRAGFGHLKEGFLVLNTDRANGGFLKVRCTQQHRQQPTGLGAVIAANRKREPAAGTEFLEIAWGFFFDCLKLFRCAVTRLVHIDQHCGDGLGTVFVQQFLGELGVGLRHTLGPVRIVQQTLFVVLDDLVSGRRVAPFRCDLCPFQKAFGLFHHFRRDDQRRDTFTARATCPARAVQQAFGVGRQIGMDDKVQVRQVDTACGHIGGHTNPRTSVAHRLKRVGAFGLAQFARQRHNRQTTVRQTRCQVVHLRACVGKDDRAFTVVETQQVEDRVVAVGMTDAQRGIGDVCMLLGFAHRVDALCIALVRFGQLGNDRRYRRREQQSAALFGGAVQNEFQIFAEAQIKHFVRFIQHHSADVGQVQRTASDVIAQTARCAHNNMRTAFQ